MNYREIKTEGFLANFVQCFWCYETGNTEVQHTILPDGYFDFIAVFENQRLTSAELTGIWTKPKCIEIRKNTVFFAVRFKLLAIEYLFKKELKSILDTTVRLPFTFLNMDNYACNEFERFAADTLSKLNNPIKYLNEIDTRKLKLFETIYRQQVKTVSELSEQIGWSSRQINRYFNVQFGISLKEFLRIVRCNASYKDISNGSLYPKQEYFDQAHFIREVKKYTGTTPKELYKNKNDRFLQLSTTRQG